MLRLTSGGVPSLGERRSIVGFDGTDLGDRSIERREFCSGEGESASDLVTPLVDLLTRGVAGDTLLLGVSDKADLRHQKNTIDQTPFSNYIQAMQDLHVQSLHMENEMQFNKYGFKPNANSSSARTTYTRFVI